MIENDFIYGFVIKRPTTVNSNGIMQTTYNTVITTSGRLRPLTGNEIYQNEKRNLRSTHRFYCGIIDIQVEDYILFGGKYYAVKYIKNPMEANEFLQVDCEYRQDIQTL